MRIVVHAKAAVRQHERHGRFVPGPVCL